MLENKKTAANILKDQRFNASPLFLCSEKDNLIRVRCGGYDPRRLNSDFCRLISDF
jgi:hypothetical protein